jgi:RNA polymerase sigma-70 factor (ECF subfamily)
MEPDQVARFEQLFAAHYGDLMRFATRRVGADAAGDVVSSTFLIAWRRLADVPAGQGRAWLCQRRRGALGADRHAPIGGIASSSRSHRSAGSLDGHQSVGDLDERVERQDV